MERYSKSDLLRPGKRIQCFPLFLDLNRRIKNHSYVEINLRKDRFFQFHFPGNAGDSLSHHRDSPFSTKDRDNDGRSGSNCAISFKGAWWYQSCYYSNLNGLYHRGRHSSYDGVNWYNWKGNYYSVKRAEMKLKPVNF